MNITQCWIAGVNYGSVIYLSLHVLIQEAYEGNLLTGGYTVFISNLILLIKHQCAKYNVTY